VVKPSVFVVAAVSFLVGGSITFAILRWLDKGNPSLAFIMGAILGTQLAAVRHHRSPGATNSAGVKASIGAVLVISMLILGVALHLLFAPFRYPEITLSISAIGSFVFPFVLFDMTWRSLSTKREAR
jgi:ABC-type spermidine/putrescine transport system permease subunit II